MYNDVFLCIFGLKHGEIICIKSMSNVLKSSIKNNVLTCYNFLRDQREIFDLQSHKLRGNLFILFHEKKRNRMYLETTKYQRRARPSSRYIHNTLTPHRYSYDSMPRRTCIWPIGRGGYLVILLGVSAWRHYEGRLYKRMWMTTFSKNSIFPGPMRKREKNWKLVWPP